MSTIARRATLQVFLFVTRAARLFDVQVEVDAQGLTQLRWTKVESWRQWTRRSAGRYLLRSYKVP